MASIRKRNDKWQAQVRRTAIPPRTQSFINRADALPWIRQTELELELDRTVLAYALRLINVTANVRAAMAGRIECDFRVRPIDKPVVQPDPRSTVARDPYANSGGGDYIDRDRSEGAC